MANDRLEKRIERIEARQEVCEQFIRRDIKRVPGGYERAEEFDRLIEDAKGLVPGASR